MLVRFDSSETGEVLMYADVAKVLLQAMGKETTARGAFLPEQDAAGGAGLARGGSACGGATAGCRRRRG